MASDVVVVYAHEEPPESWHAAVFLAGPTPRSPEVASWRPPAIDLLRKMWVADRRLVVFSPEDRSGPHDDYAGQIDWEERGLNLADMVIFWVPRDLATMPAFTTNVEWGAWHDSRRVVFGAPPKTPKNNYLLHYADKVGVPTATSMADTIAAALAVIGPGTLRRGGEREIPLLVWNTAGFQRWHAAQRAAGNTLRGARVVWTFCPDPAGPLVMWALHAQIDIPAEGRIKQDEVVISCPDDCAVALYKRGDSLDDSTVVLIRDICGPALPHARVAHELPGVAHELPGVAHELPGGAVDGGADPAQAAAAAVEDKTGLVIDAGRFRGNGSRQVAATFAAHHSYLFSAEITDDELALLRGACRAGHRARAAGMRADITTFGDICADRLVDWATLGMIAEALS